MTRGKGIYDDEDSSQDSEQTRAEPDESVDEKTPDVDKGSGEPTA